jgi:hypothetical protein
MQEYQVWVRIERAATKALRDTAAIAPTLHGMGVEVDQSIAENLAHIAALAGINKARIPSFGD